MEVASVAAIRYPQKKVRLIHSSDRVLHNMSPKTSDFATKRLLAHNVELVLNHKVVEICEKNVTLDS